MWEPAVSGMEKAHNCADLSYRRIRRYSVWRLKRPEARDFSHVRFTWMIDLVQEVSDTPICIDSPSARRPEVEQYSDGTPVEGGYLDQICLGKGLFRWVWGLDLQCRPNCKEVWISQSLPSVPGNVHGAGCISSWLCRPQLERCEGNFCRVSGTLKHMQSYWRKQTHIQIKFILLTP